MSEAVVAEPEVPSPLPEPSSETASEEPSSTQAEQPAAETGEQPSGELPERTAPEAATSPEERHAQLQAKLDAEGLTAEEGREFKRLDQSVRDRQAFQQARLAQLRQEQQQYEQAVNQTRAALEAEMQAIFDRENERTGGAPDLGLVQERQRDLLQRYHGVAEYVYQQPVISDLNRRLLELRGDSAELRDWLGKTTWQQKLAQVVADTAATAKLTPPSADYVVLKKSDLDKQIKDARQAALDAYKAANPGARAPASGNGGTPAPSGALSKEEAESLPSAELQKRLATMLGR